MTGSDSIALNTSSGDFLPSAPFKGVIQPDQQWPIGYEGREQLTQEQSTALKWGPTGPTEEAMEPGKSGFVAQAKYSQEGRNGAFVGGEDRPDEQRLSVDPGGPGKHLGKGGDNISEPFRGFEHLQMVSGGAEVSLSTA